MAAKLKVVAHDDSGLPPEARAMRRCVGSATFGIEPHEAPTDTFPVQPSRKDGLGVMCTDHWRQYVKALRERAKAKAANAAQDEPEEMKARPAPPPSLGPLGQAFGEEAVKTRRHARAPKVDPEAAEAEALIAKVDALPGPEHVKRVGEPDVQAALEVAAKAAVGAERMEV